MKDVGTLQELGLKVGDVVECVNGPIFGSEWTAGRIYKMTDKGLPCDRNGPQLSSVSTFRLVSRANTPKLWRDMTPEEKGALLLAAHEGKVIEVDHGTGWVLSGVTAWYGDSAYRIKQKLKVEVVSHGYKKT